jgi:hypothetical protein
MGYIADELGLIWQARLLREYPQQTSENRQSIARWLLGENLTELERATPNEIAIFTRQLDRRYKILQKRYLGRESVSAYRHLIDRLSLLMISHSRSRSWILSGRDRPKAVLQLIEKVVRELLTGDRYIQDQLVSIARCTQDRQLRNALLLASIEEYCYRSIKDKPLLIHRAIDMLFVTALGNQLSASVN